MNKKSVIKLCILIGVAGGYGYHFYTNPKGVYHQRELIAENAKIVADITAVEAEIDTIKTKTIGLESNRFEQEKIMREDLQLSCTNEYVYLLPKAKKATI